MGHNSRQINEPYLHNLVEFSPHGLLVVDRLGQIVFANREAERIFGYPRQELLNRSFESLIPRRYWEKHLEFGKEPVKSPDGIGMGIGGEAFVFQKNGSGISIEVFFNPVPTEDGSFVAVSVLDVKASRRAEHIFKMAIESSPNGIVIVDSSGAMKVVNREVEHLFGYEREELLGRPVEILIPERFRSRHSHYREEFCANPSTRRMGAGRDLVGLRKDGTEFPIEIGLNPVQTDEGTVILGVIADITDRKRAEESLRQLNEKLEEHVNERTAQLRALAAALTRTEEEERHKLAQALHDHLQQLLIAANMRVTQAAGRTRDEALLGLLKQVEELLLQSVQESRSLTAELSPPILYQAGLAAGLQWLGRWMQEKHGLQVSVRAQAELNDISDDLKAFLFRSTHELLFNTVKHAGVKTAFVEAEAGANKVRIVVQDSGQGSDPSGAKAGKANHTGFGLFSIRERLTYMGGRMDIDSAPGRGTKITIEVPIPQEIAVAQIHSAGQDSPAPFRVVEPEPFQPAPGAGVPIRVLLADDHKIVRDGLSSLLAEQPGIEVVGQAEDGLAAVEMARSLHPDVVVMDVTMPRMDGLEATRRLRAESLAVHVIGLSMHTEADMAQAMCEAGAEAYLNKAGPAERLVEAIRSCHNRAA